MVFNSLVLPDGVRSQNEFIRTRRAIHPALQMEMYLRDRERERETGWFSPWWAHDVSLLRQISWRLKKHMRLDSHFRLWNKDKDDTHLFSCCCTFTLFLKIYHLCQKNAYVIQILGRHFVSHSCYIYKYTYNVKSKQHFKHDVLKCPSQQPTCTFQTNKTRTQHCCLSPATLTTL